MADYNPFDHDCGVVTTTYTSGIGLTLLRDAKGKPAWEEFDDEILAQQFFTGAPDATYRPPHKDIRYIRDDWRAGYGLKYYDSNDPKRYYSSKNCDARFRGKIIAGPLAATVNKPTAETYYALALTDAGLNTWLTTTNLEYWTEVKDVNTAITRDAAISEGSYSCEIKSTDTGSRHAHIIQSKTWHNEYRGHYVKLTADCQSNYAGTFKIIIDYGTGGTQSSSFDAGDSAVNTLTIAWHKIPANADALSVTCDMQCGGHIATGNFDNLVFTPTYSEAVVGVPVADREFNSKHYKSFGNILGVRTADNFSYVEHFPGTITDLQTFAVSGVDYLYIAVGDSHELWYMTAGQVFTKSSSECAYFLTATGSTLYCIKQAGGNYLRKTTAVDTWSNVTYVGHAYDNHTDLLIAGDNAVIVGKVDMPYYIDSSDNDQALMASFATLQSSTNCKNSLLASGNLYIQGGDQTLKEFDGTPGSAAATETNISPAHFMTELDDFNGAVQAIAADDEYLLIAMDDGDDIQILAGRWETIGSSTDWGWHPIAELELVGCESLFVSSVSKKRLWINSTDADNDISYIPLTTKYGDIANDDNYTYQTGGEFIEPWQHGNLKGDNKAHYSITATLGHSHDTAIYFTAYYMKWGDADWTEIGDLVGTSSDRTHTLYVPDDDDDAHPVSPFFDIKLVPVLDSPYTTSPILESYYITGAWRPTKRPMISCIIESDEEFVLSDGQIDKGTITDIKTALDEANAATWPVTFYDIDGATITVNFVEMRPDVIEIEHISDQRKRLKRIYRLLLQKVTLS